MNETSIVVHCFERQYHAPMSWPANDEIFHSMNEWRGLPHEDMVFCPMCEIWHANNSMCQMTMEGW